MQFKRSISPIALFFTAVGCIIGSGWLFGPMLAAQTAGPASIISWIVGGILMSIVALTFAELAAAFPMVGGMVRYVQMSHGPLMSFTISWIVWLSSVATAPIETFALLQYSANYFPTLMQNVDGVKTLTPLGIFVATIIMFFMCILNCFGAKFFSRSSNIIVFLKLLVPILTILILLNINFDLTSFTLANGFAPFGWQGIFAALPLGAVIYSYFGYTIVIQLAGETQKPQKAIPFAIIGSLLFCMILYVFLQVAFIGSLRPEDLALGWHNLSFKNDSGPFAGILERSGIGWFILLIYADAIISPFGTAYIYVASTARVTYALSDLGFFPAWLKKLNIHAVPMRAIWINFIAGMLLFLLFSGWQTMVSFLISCFVISYAIGPIALLTLRKAYPEQPRPFQLPYAKIIAPIAFYICNMLVFWTGWQTVSYLLIALGMGILMFVMQYIRLGYSSLLDEFNTALWLIPYFIGLGLISYLGSFGGGVNLLKFGMDFIVMALFSCVIFYYSVRLALPGRYSLQKVPVLVLE